MHTITHQIIQKLRPKLSSRPPCFPSCTPKIPKIHRFLLYLVIYLCQKFQARFSEADYLIDRYALLVPPRRLQNVLPSKSYRTRGLNRRFENLQGFVNLPMDVMFEVSLCQVVLNHICSKCPRAEHRLPGMY